MTAPLDAHIGRRLRQRRKIIGLTQGQVAEAVGIRFQQVHKYECGANKVSASKLFTLARALGVPVAYFFEGYAETMGGEAVADGLTAAAQRELH